MSHFSIKWQSVACYRPREDTDWVRRPPCSLRLGEQGAAISGPRVNKYRLGGDFTGLVQIPAFYGMQGVIGMIVQVQHTLLGQCNATSNFIKHVFG